MVQQVHEGGQQLWGALPEAPSRTVLLQCDPDLLCADWEKMQQALAAPMLQQGNAVQAAATAVAAAAAAVAAATGRGEDHAAASAAAAAAGAAAAAVSVAHAMGSASTPQPSLAPAETDAAAAPAAGTEAIAVPAADYGDDVLAAADCECAELLAASPDASDSTVPFTVSQQTAAVLPAGPAVLDSNTSAATASPSAQQLVEAAGLAAAAGAFASASQPSSSSSTLRRGAGLLVLLRNGWRVKARPLNGSLLVRGVAYTCHSIVELMSHEGLLLHKGHQQTVTVRVAAEFLAAGSSSDAVGTWSKQAFSVAVWPEETLLLHCQPPQPVGRKFKSYSSACTHTYEALFGWTLAVLLYMLRPCRKALRCVPAASLCQAA
jgi:hypothetical protein